MCMCKLSDVYLFEWHLFLFFAEVAYCVQGLRTLDINRVQIGANGEPNECYALRKLIGELVLPFFQSNSIYRSNLGSHFPAY